MFVLKQLKNVLHRPWHLGGVVQRPLAKHVTVADPTSLMSCELSQAYVMVPPIATPVPPTMYPFVTTGGSPHVRTENTSVFGQRPARNTMTRRWLPRLGY